MLKAGAPSSGKFRMNCGTAQSTWRMTKQPLAHQICYSGKSFKDTEVTLHVSADQQVLDDTKCHVSDLSLPPLRLKLPDKQRGGKEASDAWDAWLGTELSSRLVGVSAATSRAEVRTVGVRSASVNKGLVRAEEVDVLMELEGLHKEASGVKMRGVVRVVLKTEDGRDQICISDALWDPEQGSEVSKEVQAEIMAAADMPLESALALRLNDLLWDVERRSIDQSMSIDETIDED